LVRILGTSVSCQQPTHNEATEDDMNVKNGTEAVKVSGLRRRANGRLHDLPIDDLQINSGVAHYEETHEKGDIDEEYPNDRRRRIPRQSHDE
jgi:hypothetical protein